MAKFTLVSFLCCLSLVVATDLYATTDSEEAVPVLRSGFVEFPPFKYVDENGEASGPWVEMTEKVVAEAGYRVKWINLPIARIYRYLEQGRIDLWPGVAGIPDLRGKVYESTASPMHVTLFAFHRSDTRAPDTLSDLIGEPLILISGFSYIGALDGVGLNEDDLSYAPDHRAALRMLELGRGRYVLDYDEPVAAIKHHFPDLDLTGSAIHKVRGAFVVSATRPDAQQLVRKLDRAYNSLLLRGKLKLLQ